MDLPHYEAIGTMAHALDYHAEKAYAELRDDQQKAICEKVFQAHHRQGNRRSRHPPTHQRGHPLRDYRREPR